jgi:hypothetical protein
VDADYPVFRCPADAVVRLWEVTVLGVAKFSQVSRLCVCKNREDSGVWVPFYHTGLLLFQLKNSLFKFMGLELKCLVTSLLCLYSNFNLTRV